MRRFFGGCLLLLSAGFLLFALWILDRGAPSDGRAVYANEEGEAAEEAETCAVYVKVPVDEELLAKYQAYNQDVVGIIRIAGTVLNHPVVHTPEDEEYYLLRGLDGEYNSHGVPLLSAESQMEGEGGNRIIYGHNIHKRTRDVFCDLAGYEDLAFYKEHPVIETVSESGTRRWLIFAYFITDNADEDPFRYSDTLEFSSLQGFKEYMDEVEKRNWLNVPMDRTIADTYLTLSSCSNELAGSGTNRMVVMALEIPYLEDISGIVEGTSMRESPRLPKKLSPEENAGERQ